MRELLPPMRSLREAFDSMTELAKKGHAGKDVDNMEELQYAMARMSKAWNELTIEMM